MRAWSAVDIQPSVTPCTDGWCESPGRSPSGALASAQAGPCGQKGTKQPLATFAPGVEGAKLTGTYVDPTRSRITLGASADLWIDAQADLSPTTQNRYEGIIRTHIRPRGHRCGSRTCPTLRCSGG